MRNFLNIRKYFSKIKNIIFKYKINFTSRLTSFPYISGDTFLSISDCCIINFKYKPCLLKLTNKKDLIFIENDLLSIKWVFNEAKKYKKVILHNGDKSPKEEILNELTKNKIFVFGTNIRKLNKYIEPIPIGIENAHFQRNGSLDYYNPINISKLKIIKNNLLLVSFSVQTNPMVREKYTSILNEFGYQNKYYRNLNDYRRILASSFFVISPPGNGIDCHRTWEAFIHKTIPVIERKYDLFKHIDLPILVVDKIQDFLEYSDEKKLMIYKDILEKKYESIFIKWWIDYIFSK